MPKRLKKKGSSLGIRLKSEPLKVILMGHPVLAMTSFAITPH